MSDLAYLVALHHIDGLGPIRLRSLLNYYPSPQEAWLADPKELKTLGITAPAIALLLETRKTLEPEKLLEKITKQGIKILSIFDDDYPQLLKEIYDPPMIIYYRGEFIKADNHSIAVVGSRKITGYGKAVTEKITADLTIAGLTIVSGLAKGVDSIAHLSALENEGRTIAVLGGGINKIFPPENTNLARRIIDGRGAVMSEYPPDYPHLAGNFPARNRIVAGIAKAVLVTEAAVDSGSLITARLALDGGKDVFAIPGPITSPQALGTASLIKEGAKVVTAVSDILEELGIEKRLSAELRVKSYENLSEIEKMVLECLENESRHIDEICREIKKSSAEVSGCLVKMEILGVVKNLGSGNYSLSI